MRNHKLIQVCRLLRLIILTDKFCHVLKTLCSGKKMQPTLAMVAFNLLFIKGERDAEGIAVVLPVPQGPQFWLQNLLVESTAGPRGSTTASQQVPYPPSLSLQIKLLQMPSLNPMGWQWGLCRGKVISLLWAGGFSIVFLQGIFTNLTVLCGRTMNRCLSI